MQKNEFNSLKAAILGLALGLMATPVLADKPDHAGQGGAQHGERGQNQKDHKGRGENQQGKGHGVQHEYSTQDRRDDRGHDGDRGHSPAGTYFHADKRVVVRDYFDHEIRSGHCPPGLAKKHNGCQPPGQARKWRKGYPLPRDVVYYDLPEALIIQLGRPPASHRYVRVGADILLIAIGSGMVVDAIEDLGNL
ncbi:MAG: RcnB family protein [Azovibrio sp.]|uniref:RcnB family protein n=1 Tax=Azovibrio sp. TaxID=1872673 RepID=UPI003C796D70